MIQYKIGKHYCKLDWDNFLHVINGEDKLYKSDFNDFTHLYEYIDRNIKSISHLLFDNSESHLENGILHNLNGYATLEHFKGGFVDRKERYYINGEMIYFEKQKGIYDPCKNVEQFNVHMDNLYYFKDKNTIVKLDLEQVKKVNKLNKKIKKIKNV